MDTEHSKVREQFYGTYGRHLQNVDRYIMILSLMFRNSLAFAQLFLIPSLVLLASPNVEIVAIPFFDGFFFYLIYWFCSNCLCAFRHCFGPDSGFLRQLFFFFSARNAVDISVLVETSRLLHHFVQHSGNFNHYHIYLLKIFE